MNKETTKFVLGLGAVIITAVGFILLKWAGLGLGQFGAVLLVVAMSWIIAGTVVAIMDWPRAAAEGLAVAVCGIVSLWILGCIWLVTVDKVHQSAVLVSTVIFAFPVVFGLAILIDWVSKNTVPPEPPQRKRENAVQKPSPTTMGTGQATPNTVPEERRTEPIRWMPSDARSKTSDNHPNRPKASEWAEAAKDQIFEG